MGSPEVNHHLYLYDPDTNTTTTRTPTPPDAPQDRFVTSVSSGFYHSIAITCKRSGEGPLGAARGLAVDLLQLLDNERQSDVRYVVPSGLDTRMHTCPRTHAPPPTRRHDPPTK